MTSKICILDYGSGNVASVYNMASRLSSAMISNSSSDLENASHIILPGVGSFGASISKIREKIPLDVLFSSLEKGKPFLGICVGMQVLAEFGSEFGKYEGLGLIPGTVDELNSVSERIPHIGWNNIQIQQNHPLVNGITEKDDFYFVHSFALNPSDPKMNIATTSYGADFTSVIARENVMGVQFHPEKSQISGLTVLSNFLGIQ